MRRILFQALLKMKTEKLWIMLYPNIRLSDLAKRHSHWVEINQKWDKFPLRAHMCWGVRGGSEIWKLLTKKLNSPRIIDDLHIHRPWMAGGGNGFSNFLFEIKIFLRHFQTFSAYRWEGGGSEISRLWLENKVKLKCFFDIFKDSAPKDWGGGGFGTFYF